MREKLIKKTRFCFAVEISFCILTVVFLVWTIYGIIGKWDNLLMMKYTALMLNVCNVVYFLSRRKRQKLQTILNERYPTDTYTHNDLEDINKFK